MPRLTWGGSGQKIFESGVDRGVIYPESSSLGVPWNGLLSVTRNPNGGAATQYFLDGQLRTTLITPEHFAGTVDAYTYPDALAVADGTAAEATGLSFGLQPRKRFGMTWRTGIGNDVNGIDAGYKIHILYNALAIPTPKGHKTRGVDNAPSTFNWNIVGHPVEVANRRNTSYLVIDSTKANPATIKILEYMLYGSDNTSARLPTPSQVKTLFDNWAGIYVAPEINIKGTKPNTISFITGFYENPSFEAALANDVGVWVNLKANPLPTSVTGYSGANGATVTYASNELTVNMGTAAQTGLLIHSGTPKNNVMLSVSLDLTIPATGVYALNSTGDWNMRSADFNLAAGTHRFHWRGVATGTTAGSIYLVRPGTGTAHTIKVKKICVVEGPHSDAYFDGNTTYDNDFTPVWSGTANASESVLRGKGVAGIAQQSGRSIIQSSRYALQGSYSLRIIDNSATPDNAAAGAIIRTFGTADVGKTFTAYATMNLDKAGDETAPSTDRAQRAIYVLNRVSQGVVARGINTFGNQALVLRFVVTANGQSLRLGGSSNESAWWDKVQIFEGNYSGPYFDGSTPPPIIFNKKIATTSWDGTPNASTSRLSFIASSSLPTDAAEGDAYIIDGRLWVMESDLWRNKGPV